MMVYNIYIIYIDIYVFVYVCIYIYKYVCSLLREIMFPILPVEQDPEEFWSDILSATALLLEEWPAAKNAQ